MALVVTAVVYLLFGLVHSQYEDWSKRVPDACYEGSESDVRKPILYNPNITICSSPNIRYCYEYTHNDQNLRVVRTYGCAISDDHPCNVVTPSLQTCLENVKLEEYNKGRLCCSRKSKYFVPQTFHSVSSCYTGTTNSSGDFVVGGLPEACDERKSMYCVAKMTVLDEDILEAKFFCDLTTERSECGNDTFVSCSEPNYYPPGQNRTRVCCCPTTDCNAPLYMLRKGQPPRVSSFPGSPMLLYILLVVFGCIVLLGLVMMAGKQCGASSSESVDFDDRASFDRLDFDETENDEPGPSSVNPVGQLNNLFLGTGFRERKMVQNFI